MAVKLEACINRDDAIAGHAVAPGGEVVQLLGRQQVAKHIQCVVGLKPGIALVEWWVGKACHLHT